MKPFISTVFLICCCLNLFAQDGIYESVLKAEGVESKLTREPEKGASIWMGDLAEFVTDEVHLSKFQGRDRVEWVGRFIGARPNWLLIKNDGEVFAAVGILGPSRLTEDGSISSHGVDGRYRVSFEVKDVQEAAKLRSLLQTQGKSTNHAEQAGPDQPPTRSEFE